MSKRKKNKKPQSMQQLLMDYVLEDKGGYITREFQDYGYRLAIEMGEEKRKGMYIKLAKNTDRKLLEKARVFVKDAKNVKNPGRLFMWAVGKLKRGENLYGENEKKKDS